jgi:EpsI family protein
MVSANSVAADSAPRQDVVLAGAVLLSFVVCYAGVIASLFEQWMSNDMYAHGILIPFISAYLLWDRRALLASTPVEPALVSGSLLFGTALAMLFVGHVGGVISLEQVSLIVAILGLVLLLFGKKMLARTVFPLVFLLFMIPIWDVVTNRLHAPFQLLSARIGASLLSAVGIPIRIEGVFIELPNMTLEVAQACSGVNFLVAILALALPQAYLMLQGIGLQIFVAGFAAIVALVTNGLRVALIGLLAYTIGSGPDVHGPGHVLQGLSVAVVGFVVLFATIVLLSKLSPRKSSPNVTETRVESFTPSRLGPRLTITVSMILFVTAAAAAAWRVSPVEPARPLAEVPSNLGSWVTLLSDATAPPFRARGATHELARTYLAPSRRQVRLYIGYFVDQSQGRELVTEQTLALMQGAKPVTLRMADGRNKDASELVRTAKGTSQYVLSWYELNGHSTSNGYSAKAWTTWDALVRRRTSGAVVTLTADVATDADVREAAADVQELATLVAPVLETYLPR